MNPNGNVKHGGHGTLTYSRWKSMLQRVRLKPDDPRFEHYGGRGVVVCERWHEFPAFLSDLGECPDRSMTLDRIKNEIGYEPGNCRWATRAMQNRNRSHCVPLTHKGVTKNVTDWAADIGLTPNTLSMRLRNGWSVDQALTTPPNTRR